MNKKDKKQIQNNPLFVSLTAKEQQQLSGGGRGGCSQGGGGC